MHVACETIAGGISVKRILSALLCGLLLCVLVGGAAVAEEDLIEEPGLTVLKAYLSPLWEVDVLFVALSIHGADGETLDTPLRIKAFQSGSELTYLKNPEDIPARTELLIQLKNTEDDVKIKVEAGCPYEQVLRLAEIPSGDPRVTEETVVQFQDAASTDAGKRAALPDGWPLGLPMMSGLWKLAPFIDGHVGAPDGAFINLNPVTIDDAHDYVERCVAAGYVKSQEGTGRRNNYRLYTVTLTGQGYTVLIDHYSGEQVDYESCDMTVKRTGE